MNIFNHISHKLNVDDLQVCIQLKRKTKFAFKIS